MHRIAMPLRSCRSLPINRDATFSRLPAPMITERLTHVPTARAHRSHGDGELLGSAAYPWRTSEAWLSGLQADGVAVMYGYLRRLLREFVDYYHNDRTHLSLGKDPPAGRVVYPPSSTTASVASVPRIGGSITATSGDRPLERVLPERRAPRAAATQAARWR